MGSIPGLGQPLHTGTHTQTHTCIRNCVYNAFTSMFAAERLKKASQTLQGLFPIQVVCPMRQNQLSDLSNVALSTQLTGTLG